MHAKLHAFFSSFEVIFLRPIDSIEIGRFSCDKKSISCDYGFAIDWMRKDLKIAIEEAKRNGSPVPITEIIDDYYAEVQEMGGNRWDSSGLIARLKKKK